MSDMLTPEEALANLDIRMQPVIKRGPGRSRKTPEFVPSELISNTYTRNTIPWPLDITDYSLFLHYDSQKGISDSVNPISDSVNHMIKEAAKLPQRVIAKKYGISQSTLSRILRSHA